MVPQSSYRELGEYNLWSLVNIITLLEEIQFNKLIIIDFLFNNKSAKIN